MSEISFGLIIPQGWQIDLPPDMSAREQFDLIIRMAKEAEKIGYDSVWLFDHFQTSPLIPVVPLVHGKSSVFECYTALSVLSKMTEKVRLGEIVTCAMHRPPAYLGKITSVLDVMSNGRLELGIGACWNEYELNAYGYEFYRPAERIQRLAETIEIVKKMWTEDVTSYDGRYYKIIENYNYPKPIQKPHPPILVGGGGEKYTLEVVAKHADKWNYGWGIEGYRRKLQVLKEHCRRVGRQSESITLTYTADTVVANTDRDAEELFTNWREQQSSVLGKQVKVNTDEFRRDQILGGTERTVRMLCEIIEELGVSEFILYMPAVSFDLKLMRLFYEEVIEPVRELAKSLVEED